MLSTGLHVYLVECLVPDGGPEAGAAERKRSLHQLSLSLLVNLKKEKKIVYGHFEKLIRNLSTHTYVQHVVSWAFLSYIYVYVRRYTCLC